MKLGYQTNTWGGVVGHPVGVTSIKDLFYLANGSTEQALREIAAAGYQGFELFDGNLMQYESNKESFRALMKETGLSFIGVYSGANFIFPDILDEEFWRIEKAAALAAELGAEHLIVGGGAKRAAGTTEQDYVLLAQGLDRVVDVAAKYGLIASYHPHLTTIVETPEQLEKVMSRSKINFNPDTAHLAAAGGDPAALIRQYADRIKYIHLKDWTPEPFNFVPLGEGKLDMAAVVEAIHAVKFDGWVTVELDSHPNPKLGAEISKRWLAGRL